MQYPPNSRCMTPKVPGAERRLRSCPFPTERRRQAVQTSAQWRLRFACSAVDLASTTRREAPMPAEPLRATEVARRLGVPTRELLRLVHERKIRYVMLEGIAHIPAGAIEEYRAKAS